MILLIFYAFFAGIVTILSPCVFPLLPILLSSSTGRQTKAYGLMIGFILSFVFVMLIVSAWAVSSSTSVEMYRIVSVGVLFIFGCTLLIDKLQNVFETLISPITRHFSPSANASGFAGGIVIGLSLGIVWSPCIGPILATVLSLAMIGKVTVESYLITGAYALGTALPMMLIINGGRKLIYHKKTIFSLGIVRKFFGIVMIITAIIIYLDIDTKFQSYVLTTYPTYTSALSNIDNNPSVIEELEKLKK